MDVLSSYQKFLRKKVKTEIHQPDCLGESLSVAIVGAGISGLYSALLLQRYIPNVKVKIFEANNRVGGRIFTYRFSNEPYQYSEAGAMRMPCIPSQEPVFKLIDYLNKLVPGNPIKLIEFVNSFPSGNRVYLNHTKMKDGRIMTSEYADAHCSELGFPQRAQIKDSDCAWKLMKDALEPVMSDLRADFEKAMDKYGNMSLHQYLVSKAGWSEEYIQYFEVVSTITNKTHSGLIDMILSFFLIFGADVSYKTIQGGMSLLPELCANLVSNQGGEIMINSKVQSLSEENNSVKISYINPLYKSICNEIFDAVILAVPPGCIRSLERRVWSCEVECALRSMRHVPVVKILIRFKSRFWERTSLQHGPSLGGTSITDLRSRCIIYPSYGIGDEGEGILCLYLRESDATYFPSISDTDKVQSILHDLKSIYPEVDVAAEYAGGTNPSSPDYVKEMVVIDWSSTWTMGTAGVHYPGQFSYIYPLLAQNQGNVYFAGDHLSVNPLFIGGALDSAKFAVQQLAQRQYKESIVIDFL